MYSRKSIEAEISDRFRVPAPTLLSAVGRSPPLAVSRLRSVASRSQKSKPPRPEDAYVVHVMLGEHADIQLWLNGREVPVPPLRRGALLVGSLESTPVARFNSDIDFVRFYVSKATLDEVAEWVGVPRPEGLRRPEHGAQDPVLHNLAAAIAPLIDRGGAGDQLLADHVALAFHTYLLGAYAGTPLDARPSQCTLAPWQERRAKAFIDANSARSISVVEIADQCSLSASHFSRAFRNTTGRPPHRWLLERRVEAAKALLALGHLPLAQIAADCGFSDSSHFSRVFQKVAGEPPAAWRRGARR